MVTNRETDDRAVVSGTITVREYDIERVREEADAWDQLSGRDKLTVLRRLQPAAEHTSHNIICVGHHEWVVDAMDAAQTNPPPLRTIAVGRSSSDPAESDRALNDEVYRADISAYEDGGQTISVTSVLDTREGNVDVDNGEELAEMGVYSGDESLDESTLLINHGLFDSPIPKDDTMISTVGCEFSWSPA